MRLSSFFILQRRGWASERILQDSGALKLLTEILIYAIKGDSTFQSGDRRVLFYFPKIF